MLFKSAHIITGILLLIVFCIAGRNITQTFVVADMSALNNLQPQPKDYFWELNIHQASVDKNKIRYYADYYEHLLHVFPSLRETYGLLGYCYHYLNDDPKAIKFLKMAIQDYPDYFWNYYNLGIIYIHESRYQQAADMLQKALKVDPMTSLKKMFASQMVYVPLLETNDKKAFVNVARHLKETYQSSFVLMKILDQAAYRKEMPEIMKKLNPEAYAF
jgi:tetratricopeptide (TPR) repeat protein